MGEDSHTTSDRNSYYNSFVRLTLSEADGDETMFGDLDEVLLQQVISYLQRHDSIDASIWAFDGKEWYIKDTMDEALLRHLVLDLYGILHHVLGRCHG